MVTERLRIIFSSINMTILHNSKSIINAPKHIHWKRGNKLGGGGGGFNKFHLLTGLGAQVGLHDVHFDYIHYLLLIDINKNHASTSLA
jgi:hypothetical protein